MAYDPRVHHRRSVRLAGHAYARAGAYFVTICTQGRECTFGDVDGGRMRLNDAGRIVREEWFRSAEIRREIALLPDEFVVMPNHVHGIVWIVAAADGDVNAGSNGGATGGRPDAGGASADRPDAPDASDPSPGCTWGDRRSPLRPRGPAMRSLASFVAGFKSAVTRRINGIRATPGMPVWQRNYHEHVIRNDDALNRIRRYIDENPARWPHDPNHRP